MPGLYQQVVLFWWSWWGLNAKSPLKIIPLYVEKTHIFPTFTGVWQWTVVPLLVVLALHFNVSVEISSIPPKLLPKDFTVMPARIHCKIQHGSGYIPNFRVVGDVTISGAVAPTANPSPYIGVVPCG